MMSCRDSEGGLGASTGLASRVCCLADWECRLDDLDCRLVDPACCLVAGTVLMTLFAAGLAS